MLPLNNGPYIDADLAPVPPIKRDENESADHGLRWVHGTAELNGKDPRAMTEPISAMLTGAMLAVLAVVTNDLHQRISEIETRLNGGYKGTERL